MKIILLESDLSITGKRELETRPDGSTVNLSHFVTLLYPTTVKLADEIEFLFMQSETGLHKKILKDRYGSSVGQVVKVGGK